MNERFFWWTVCQWGCSVHIEGEDPVRCPIVKCPYDGTKLTAVQPIKDRQ